MSLSLTSADVVAIGREKFLDLRDFVLVSYYRLRAVPNLGRAVMAGCVLVGGLGAGLAAVRHHLHSHSSPAAVATAAAPMVAKVVPATLTAPVAPKPTAVAEAPAAPAKLDMRATGSISPVDEPVKKKKKKKIKEHKNTLDSKR